MVSVINVIIGFLWFFSAAADYANFIHIWQLKEYRLDRFRDFLSTSQGKNFFVKYPLLWRSILAIVIFFWPFNDTLMIKYFLIGIFSLDFLYNLRLFLRKKFYRPSLTKKTLSIFIISLSFEGVVFLFTHEWTLPLLLLITRFFIVSLVIFILYFPTKLIKEFLIDRAKKKIEKYHDLVVIGITGSYGKTTVKNFLFHVLSEKFKTIKTPRNINTEIGIANFILQQDFRNTEVFIVEMGAYNMGEIKKICDMVHPKIGILTAINEQHLSLFGSIKNTQEAKYELLRALPKNGLAVVNSDNKYCREFLSELECQVSTFGLDEDFRPTFLIRDIQKVPGGVKCVGFMDNAEGEVEIPIWGEHNIMNIAPCYLVGKYLGMRREEVRERCRTLKMPKGLLEIKNYGKAVIINDSYNSNPEGFKAALGLLSTYSSDKKRIVITRGMLELGERSFELHERIGEEISFMADELVVISQDSVVPLVRGVGTKYKTNVKVITDAVELLEYVKSLKEENVVVLLENRIPSLVVKELDNL